MVAKLAPHYPLFVDLEGRLCVVLGGGKAAERRARSLGRHGADVVVIAPEVSEAIEEMQAEGLLTIERREYARGDLEGATIVVCVSGSEETDVAARMEARSRNALVYVPDAPDLCDFLLPSVTRRGGLQIAVSTGGASPVVAKRLRKRFAEEFGEEWTSYVKLLGEVRALAARRVEDPQRRALALEAAASDDLLDAVRAGEAPSAEEVLEHALREVEVEAGEQETGDE